MSTHPSEDGWNPFLELLTKVGQPEKMKLLMDLFLTIEEKETIASRYLIVKALLEGKLTQREISDQFGVSISQITRGSNALKIIDAELKSFLNKNIKPQRESHEKETRK